MPQVTRQTEQVLAVLLRSPETPRYGFEISKETGAALPTLYRILNRLELAGWVESEWEEIEPGAEARPPRRYYRLTTEGVRVAQEVVEETRRTVRGLGRPHPGWGKA